MALGTDLKSTDFAIFARATEGLGHGRGIAVSFVAMALAGGVLSTGVYAMGASRGALGAAVLFLCWILSAVIAGTGLFATGIMLLDRARVAPPRPIADALIFGLMCLLKSWVVALAILLAALLVGLAAALIYLICKLPWVGPVLLFFAHPLLVIAAGVFVVLAGLFAVLVAPALWDGDTISRAIAKTIAVLKERAVLCVLYLLAMTVVSGILLALIGAVILPGYSSMTGVAAQVIGDELAGGVSMLSQAPYSFMYRGGGSRGHMTAMMLSTGILVLFGVAAALQVQLMGLNLVYLGVSEGIDSAGAERILRRQLDQARTKADEAKQRALVAAERAKQAAQKVRPQSQAGKDASCPHCASAVSSADSFCENCGHKLK